MKLMKTCAAAAAMVALAGTAQASEMTLVDGGLGVLDSDTQLEWTANMNLNGKGTWAAANAWIDTLNTSNYAGHNDWRLPTIITSCGYGGSVYDCNGGELSHLFVNDLGNKARESVRNHTDDTAEQIANFALFSNVVPGGYWSGTEYPGNRGTAWYFMAGVGGVNYDAETNTLYAVAVRTADVAAAVPEPQTYAMLLMGLGAVLLAAKRRPV